MNWLEAAATLGVEVMGNQTEKLECYGTCDEVETLREVVNGLRDDLATAREWLVLCAGLMEQTHPVTVADIREYLKGI